MAIIDAADPLTLSHANGEREAVSNYHLARGVTIAITETGDAYTIHDEGRQWRAMFFATLPDRIDRDRTGDVFRWYAARKTYEKIRRENQ